MIPTRDALLLGHSAAQLVGWFRHKILVIWEAEARSQQVQGKPGKLIKIKNCLWIVAHSQRTWLESTGPWDEFLVVQNK